MWKAARARGQSCVWVAMMLAGIPEEQIPMVDKPGRGVSSFRTERHLKDAGYEEVYRDWNWGHHKPTVKQLITKGKMPEDCIVNTRTHIFAVVQGQVMDHGSPMRKRPKAIWVKKDEERIVSFGPEESASKGRTRIAILMGGKKIGYLYRNPAGMPGRKAPKWVVQTTAKYRHLLWARSISPYLDAAKRAVRFMLDHEKGTEDGDKLVDALIEAMKAQDARRVNK